MARAEKSQELLPKSRNDCRGSLHADQNAASLPRPRRSSSNSATMPPTIPPGRTVEGELERPARIVDKVVLDSSPTKLAVTISGNRTDAVSGAGARKRSIDHCSVHVPDFLARCDAGRQRLTIRLTGPPPTGFPFDKAAPDLPLWAEPTDMRVPIPHGTIFSVKSVKDE